MLPSTAPTMRLQLLPRSLASNSIGAGSPATLPRTLGLLRSRIGASVELDGGAGIEVVGPRSKAIYDASSKKSNMQEVVAKAISQEAYVATDILGQRLKCDDDDDWADIDDDEDDGDAHATCASARGASSSERSERACSVSGDAGDVPSW